MARMKTRAESFEALQNCTCVAILPPPETQGAIVIDAQPQTLALFGDFAPAGMVQATAWGEIPKKWPDGISLRVKFMNGDREQQKQAFARFKKVDELCGISVKQVTGGRSDIRVAFNSRSGHWSYVGTDNLRIPQQQQTMNIALNGRSTGTEWDRVAIHEFLHAIGLNHEHQHPRGAIPWDSEKVYAFYWETQGWTRREVDQQVLKRATSKRIFGTDKPDPKSIMMYPIAADLLTDPSYQVGWNTKMSQSDVQILRKVYP